MQPIIKWPGGKSREIQEIDRLIPKFDRYAEPFAGGAALFFHLAPKAALLNDSSRELMEFYRLVQVGDAALQETVLAHVKSFTALLAYSRDAGDALLALYAGGGQSPAAFAAEIYQALCEEAPPPLLDAAAFVDTLAAQAADKIRRTLASHKKRPFSEKDLIENLITGFMGGYYIYFRRVYNDILLGRAKAPSPGYQAATFYFIREYCYGAMFRYNSRGEFNIPYGGLSYNGKSLGGKAAAMFGGESGAALGRATLSNLDFQAFLEGTDWGPRDFLFLDPPYDSEFSAYSNQAFSTADQRRLCACLMGVKAQFIMVIKGTPLTRLLYEGRFPLYTFHKQYTYNMRGRNDRETEHLIITNLPM